MHVFIAISEGPAAGLATAAADSARKVLAADAGSGIELSAVVEPGIAVWDMEQPWGRA